MAKKTRLLEGRQVYTLSEAVKHTKLTVADFLKYEADGMIQLCVQIPSGTTVLAVADPKQPRMSLSFQAQDIHFLTVSHTDCQHIRALGKTHQRHFTSGYSIVDGILSEKKPSDFGIASQRQFCDFDSRNIDQWVAKGALNLYGCFLTDSDMGLDIDTLYITSADLIKLMPTLEIDKEIPATHSTTDKDRASVDTDEETPDPNWMHKYTSNKLRKLHHAVIKFWQKTKPGAKETYSSQKDIAKYLHDDKVFEFLYYLAESGAKIIKPDYVDNPVNPPDSYQESSLLRILKEGSSRYWKNAKEGDRSTYSHQETVQEWFEQQNLGSTLAKHAAIIIRPEWLKNAERPKKEPIKTKSK